MARMKRRHLYLIYALAGAILPYMQFVPWVSAHGLNMHLFVQELFSTRIGAFFGVDLLLSALVFFSFMASERRRAGVKHIWLPIVALFTVGLSLAFPLFLYLRELAVDEPRTRSAAPDI